MNPNHEQISNWYTGWKSLMPAIIVEHPVIKMQFHSALDIMSRAVGGPSMPLPPPPPTIHVIILTYNLFKYNHYNYNRKCNTDCYIFCFVGWFS